MYLEPTSKINLFKSKACLYCQMEYVTGVSKAKTNLVYNKHNLINEDKYKKKLN